MKQKIFGWLLAIVLGVTIGIIVTPMVSNDNVYSQLEKYKKVFGLTVKNYVDDVDTQKLTEAAIKGMLNDLDPHSVYINAEDMRAVQEDFQGSFEGIGVQFDMINDTITIIAPISGGPSELLGILAGDKIISIDGENAVAMNRDDVPKKLKGPKGSKVSVDIIRGTQTKPLNFVIIRDKIPLYTVDASFMFDDSDIGFIRVNRFAATTHKELRESLERLKEEGMKKLILDLRGNPGGFLQQAFYMAGEFLKAGDTIVYTQGRRPEFDEMMRAERTGQYSNLPIIVLINHGSASASEIVSGAIQDLDRGLVVGTTSFGKGLVQRQYDIGDGSAFRLTVSKYFTPSGRSIQRPYEDKVNYRRLFGRLELEEGSNIEHALETVRKEFKEEKDKDSKNKDLVNMDELPIHYTKSGRTVLGGGGITPDYIIKSDTLTDLAVQLRIKRIFYEFVNNNLQNGKDVKNTYKNDFKAFTNGFKVTEHMHQDFRKLAESKEIEWNEEQFKIDRDFIDAEIKGNLARIVWGSKEQSQLFYSTIDRQVQKALTLFPEAEKIAKLK